MINKKQIEKILSLSKISCEKSELENFSNDLNKIMGLFERIKKVDTGETTVMISPIQSHTLAEMRQDLSVEKDNIEKFRKIAPKFERRHFIVPKILKYQNTK